jgi:hypothetical protein
MQKKDSNFLLYENRSIMNTKIISYNWTYTHPCHGITLKRKENQRKNDENAGKRHSMGGGFLELIQSGLCVDQA